MPIDPFQGRAVSEGAPYDNALTVAPNDTADLPVIPSAIYLPFVPGPDGFLYPDGQDPNRVYQISMLMQNGESITILAAGAESGCKPILLPFRPRRIMATGTTASHVPLLW